MEDHSVLIQSLECIKLCSQLLLMKYYLEVKKACVLSRKQNREFHSESTGTEHVSCELIKYSGAAVSSVFG